MNQYPAFVDIHAHFREPGTNPAETIASGTRAALMGGYGFVYDMPNNPGRPTHTPEHLQEKLDIASRDAVIFLGAYAGWQPDSDIEPDTLRTMAPYACGKKDYLTKTTANDNEWTVADFMPGIRVFHEAAPQKPNMVHPANRDQIEQYIKDVAIGLGQHVHICHINDPDDAELVARYREMGAPVSSGLTPHHAVKTSHDVLTHGKFAEMMPPLAEQTDTEKLLWQLDQGIIDIVETDHAPHPYENKMNAENSGGDCFGVPGIEFAFPVLNYQVEKGRLSKERLIDAMSTRPAAIMGLPDFCNTGTYCEWTNDIYRIEDEKTQVHSGSEWTPFLGNMAAGRLVRVVLGGRQIYSAEQVYPLNNYDVVTVINAQSK